ncbi:AbrB/MazE/SpoVT family DNA-binding domain-containing protein [Bacillus cereus]|uniref:AbrB/MazE/SpoVT family DNA-binding domain-containing protein n=1 Tax=Bacillus cereus TaxID=1396 RepID=UPI0020D20B8A|nr:AbrB/MazE/SpoVT family DNA-binding domain-containing protein [Bacillus cereus]
MNLNGNEHTNDMENDQAKIDIKKQTMQKEEVGVLAAPTKMRNWGNSMGIIIPKDIARRVGADVGSEFDLKVMDGSNEIRLVPRKQRKEYTLQELLLKCKPENRHNEIELGVEGNELI